MSLHKSTTIALLKKLSTDELNEVERFLHFSLGNKADSLKKAFVFLKSVAPEYTPKNCTKENFSKTVFGKKLTSKLDKEINRLLSELKKELEKYMVYQFASGEQNLTHFSHFMWFHSKGLLEEGQKILLRMEGDLLNRNTQDVRELYLFYLESKILHAMVTDDNSACYFLFQHYYKFLQSKFEIELDIASTGFVNIQSITAKSSEAELKKGIKNDFLKLDFSEEAAFFKAQLQLTKAPTVELYQYLKGKLVEDNLLISDKDKGGTLAILKNKVARVFPNFEKESLDLMEMKFEVSKKLRNGGAVHYILDEYIEALISCGMLEKAKQVLAENKPHIVGLKDKENFCNIYEAVILEKSGHFEDALQIANNCYGENKEQRIYILVLKVRLAYELKQSNLFKSYLNNLRKYLSTKGKKEYSDRIIRYVLGVVSTLSKIYKTPKHETKKLMEIRQKVEADKSIHRKDYLFKKIDEKLNSK
ncbi:MAG: hypothetical protein KIS94_00440 [Chitinophagales bacterium]|nr:hypothetical protein [Chitinophagales bacterium]